MDDDYEGLYLVLGTIGSWITIIYIILRHKLYVFCASYTRFSLDMCTNIFVGLFCTSKVYDGQDHVFLFWGGFANYVELQSTI
jgi:hypothetical protein